MKIALNTLTGLNRKQLQHYLGWAKRGGLTNINLNSKTADLTSEWERLATAQGELILVGYWVESSKGDQLFAIEWTEQKTKAEEAEEMAAKVAQFVIDHKEDIERDVKRVDELTVDEMFQLYLEWQSELDRRLMADMDGTINAVGKELGATVAVKQEPQPAAEPETTTEANLYEGLEGKYYVPAIFDGQNLEIFQDEFGNECLGSIAEIETDTKLWLCQTPDCAVVRANDHAYWYEPDKVTGFKPHGSCIEVTVQDGKLTQIKEASGKITRLRKDLSHETLLQSLPTETLCKTWTELLDDRRPDAATVRGWIMSEFERRLAGQFGRWMEDEDPDATRDPARYFLPTAA
jgi:hypothetical protein